MTIRFPRRLDVDGFATVNRRTLAAWPRCLRPGHSNRRAVRTSGLGQPGLRGLSVFARRRIRRSGTGRIRDLDQDRAGAASSAAAACRSGRSRSNGRWPPTSACARSCARAPRSRIPSSAMRCMSRSAASSRGATISISSPSARSAAAWAARARCRRRVRRLRRSASVSPAARDTRTATSPRSAT